MALHFREYRMPKYKQDLLSQAGRFFFGSPETVKRGDQSARDQARAARGKAAKKGKKKK
jgi:hypothetical protein